MNGYCNAKCSHCGRLFPKETRRVKEAIKRGWNIYCSGDCRSKGRSRKILLKCFNPKCNKVFYRLKSQFKKSGCAYCSQSCAAFVNNKKYPRIRGVRKNCAVCGKEFVSREKYCSVNCKTEGQKITGEELIKKIKELYEQNRRIPLKIEFSSAVAARKRFGSWNKAIIAAGFKPNPVKFAEKHIANDGHPCDSVAEKVIDDWLSAHNIKHEVKVPYGKNNMTADFKINDTWIEFFGLSGESKNYDRLVREKKRLWKEKNLKVIEIYPKDLFPRNKLGDIFLK